MLVVIFTILFSWKNVCVLIFTYNSAFNLKLSVRLPEIDGNREILSNKDIFSLEKKINT